jgi:hypothetical protein
VTADSKIFVAVLALLQVASTALFIAKKVRMSFGAGAVMSLLVLLVTASSWSQITGGELFFLAGEGAVVLGAIAGVAGRVSAATWWVIWTANLLMLAFLVYGAFFFHIFS